MQFLKVLIFYAGLGATIYFAQASAHMAFWLFACAGLCIFLIGMLSRNDSADESHSTFLEYTD